MTIRIHQYSLGSGIRATLEFAKKKLADHAINVGLKCGHACTYCSSGALLRCHKAFKELAESPFEFGYAIVDPDMPDKVAADAKRIRKRGVVQLCTNVDAWCPAAQEYDIGRRCLEAVLAEPGWTVRILTKNAAVAEDFDFIKKYRDRVVVGLSLTGTSAKESVIKAIEPNASPISERMAALENARRLGLRIYGMLCPILPGIADDLDQLGALVRFVTNCGAEEVFCEAANPRGPGLKNTEQALRAAGWMAEAEAVARIRRQRNWSPYVARLIVNAQAAMRKHSQIDRLRFLLYSTGLATADRQQIENNSAGVVWL